MSGLRRLFVGCIVLLLSLAAALRGAEPLPATCYLFAYFHHDREAEGFRLAWSRDALRFAMLRGGASFLKPTVGESKIMRDPALARGPDGRFHLVWTTSWDGKTIGYASSPDLVNWSEQQAIPVMAHEPEAQNCWAPEILWDEAQRHFLIYWSTTILGRFPETANTNRRPQRNHRIYSTTTRDFVTFTSTRLHYDGGYNVIDAMLVPNAPNDWLMFVKNEQLSPVTEKNIRLVRAPTPEGPFSAPSPKLTGDYWAEGPTALKIGDTWHVYFDKHMLNAIGLVCSRDLEHWEDVSDQLSFPADARHGSVIAVPREIVEPLLALP
jgi:beta-xylosidase